MTANLASIKAGIRERLEYDHVTFAELSRLPGFSGEMVMMSCSSSNLIWWPNISNEALDALAAMQAAGEFHFHPASPLVYYIDGAVPRLPIAKRPPRGGYKEPHWIPVTLKRGPSSTCQSRWCKMARSK